MDNFNKYYRLIKPEEIPKYRDAGVQIYQSRGGKFYAIIEPGTNPLRSLSINDEKLETGNDLGDAFVEMIFDVFDDSANEFFSAIEKIDNKKIQYDYELEKYSFDILGKLTILRNIGEINDDILSKLVNNYFDYIADKYGVESVIKLKVELLDKYFDSIKVDVQNINEVVDNENDEMYNYDEIVIDLYSKDMYNKIFKSKNYKVDDNVIDKFINNLKKIKDDNIDEYNNLNEIINDILSDILDNNNSVEDMYKIVNFIGNVDIVDDDEYAIEHKKSDSLNYVLSKNIGQYIGKSIEFNNNDRKYVVNVNDILPRLFGECKVYDIKINKIKASDVSEYIFDLIEPNIDTSELLKLEGKSANVRSEEISSKLYDGSTLSPKYLERYIINKYGEKVFDEEFQKTLYKRTNIDMNDFIELNKSIGCYDENDIDNHFSIEYEYVFADVFKNKIFNYNINEKYYPIVYDDSLIDDELSTDYAMEVNMGFLKGKDAIKNVAKILGIGKEYGLIQNELCGMHIHVESNDIINKFYDSMNDVDKVKTVLIISGIIDQIYNSEYISEIRKESTFAQYIDNYVDVMDVVSEFEKSGENDIISFMYGNFDYDVVSNIEEWINGGKFYAVKFDDDKGTLEYRVFENLDNSPIKAQLNVELALQLTKYINHIINGNLDEEYNKLYSGKFNLKDAIGDELYEKLVSYSRENKLRKEYLSDIATSMTTFKAKEIEDINLSNVEGKVISFERDDDTGELYRIEIDENGNKRIYNEFGNIINRGE